MCVKIERAYDVLCTRTISQKTILLKGRNPSVFSNGWRNPKKICRINGEELKTNKKRGGIKMPRPGFEPGLLRPQRSVLTTRRSRLHDTIG